MSSLETADVNERVQGSVDAETVQESSDSSPLSEISAETRTHSGRSSKASRKLNL